MVLFSCSAALSLLRLRQLLLGCGNFHSMHRVARSTYKQLYLPHALSQWVLFIVFQSWLSVCCFCREVPSFPSTCWSQEASRGLWRSQSLKLWPLGSLSLPHVPTRHDQNQSRSASAPLQQWVISHVIPSFRPLQASCERVQHWWRLFWEET